MANFPLFQMAEESVKFRFQEPFGSDAANKKSAGVTPIGIYRGYEPNPQPNYQLFVNTYGGSNDSVAVVETPTHYNLTIRTEQQLVLDFSGHTTFPVYVVLRANYSLSPHPFSGNTDAKVVTTQTVSPGDIKICQVTGFSGTFPVVATLDSTTRDDVGGLVTQDEFSNRLKVAIGTNPSYPGVNGGTYQLAIVHNFGLNIGSIVPLDSKNVGFLTNKGFMLVTAYATGWSNAQHYSNAGVVYVLPPASWGDAANQVVVQAGAAGKGGISFVVVIQLHPGVNAVSNSFIPGPFMSSAPDPLIYPNTLVGLTDDEIITISNLGDTAYTITVVTPPAAPFSIISPSLVGTSVPPGGFVTMTVRFAPTVLGNATSAVVITNSAAQVNAVALDGTGI